MSMMTYRNPVEEIREQIERLFTDFSEESRGLPFGHEFPLAKFKTGAWLPPIEVTESEQELIVSASLPGMKPENINVEVTDHSLLISGESRRESKVDEKHFHRSEFQYGQFMRRIPLPDYIENKNCKANFNNGVLEIRLHKSETSKRQKIEVKTGK